MPIEWAIILVVAVSDAILLAETSFRLETSRELNSIILWILIAIVLVVCRWRRFVKLANISYTLLVMALFSNIIAILSFLLTGILPIRSCDETLLTIDHALGLNWFDMYQWLTNHPTIKTYAFIVYRNLGSEMMILILYLELLGNHIQAKKFLRWCIISSFLAICIGALIHAAGAFVYYHLPEASTTGYVSQWADLRNGTLRTINPFSNQGLVICPSFHAALAVLCAYAARPLRVLNFPLLALNLLIILSTPAMGGHYFIDIIAGIILAAFTISLPGYILSGIRRPLKKNTRHEDVPAFSSK